MRPLPRNSDSRSRACLVRALNFPAPVADTQAAAAATEEWVAPNAQDEADLFKAMVVPARDETFSRVLLAVALDVPTVEDTSDEWCVCYGKP